MTGLIFLTRAHLEAFLVPLTTLSLVLIDVVLVLLFLFTCGLFVAGGYALIKACDHGVIKQPDRQRIYRSNNEDAGNLVESTCNYLAGREYRAQAYTCVQDLLDYFDVR